MDPDTSPDTCAGDLTFDNLGTQVEVRALDTVPVDDHEVTIFSGELVHVSHVPPEDLARHGRTWLTLANPRPGFPQGSHHVDRRPIGVRPESEVIFL